MTRRTTEERFNSKTKLDENGCLLWTGYKNPDGYGTFQFEKMPRMAHRFNWILNNGPIAEGMSVCHKCDNPACVKIEHLFLGTAKENAEDMKKKNRSLFGTRNHQHKLSEDEVKEILNDNRSTRVIGKDYGVSNTMINFIKRGIKWQYLQKDKAA